MALLLSAAKQSHLASKPRPLGELARPQVPRVVTDLVMRALESEPANRPSLGEIAETLTANASSSFAPPQRGEGGA